MTDELYRTKSMEQLKSPESLNDYIRVSNPGVWILLVSIIVLLAGACVWGFFGRIDSTTAVELQVENGIIICYLDENEISDAEVGMLVKFAGREGTIAEIGEKKDIWYPCLITTEQQTEDGVYEGELVLKRIKPASLILG